MGLAEIGKIRAHQPHIGCHPIAECLRLLQGNSQEKNGRSQLHPLGTHTLTIKSLISAQLGESLVPIYLRRSKPCVVGVTEDLRKLNNLRQQQQEIPCRTSEELAMLIFAC